MDNLNEEVHYWITINEPAYYALTSYIEGVRPPGEKNIRNAIKVLNNLINANNNAYKLIHSKSKDNDVFIGMANAIWPIINFENVNQVSFIWDQMIRFLNYLINYIIIIRTRKYAFKALDVFWNMKT